MCSRGSGHDSARTVVGEERMVDLARDEALQAADDVLLAQALCCASCHIVHRGLMPAHADRDDSIEGRVGLAMAAVKEPVAMRHPTRCWNRARAAQLGKRRFRSD